MRKIRASDFHIPVDEAPDAAPEERGLWIEANFEFPELELEDADDMPAVPGNFAHMLMVDDEEPVRVRFRLAATLDQDGDIEESFTYVNKTDDAGMPTEESALFLLRIAPYQKTFLEKSHKFEQLHY